MVAIEKMSEGDGRTLVRGFPGGYWRYGVTDHVLLVNIYFPPKELYAEFSERLPELISCYPSPHERLVEEMGSLICQDPRHLAIGNGVSELINASIQALEWRIAVPTPSFNPYETVVSPGRLFRFALPPPDFELDTEAFATHAIRHKVDCAVVISPNNPTSRAVPHLALSELADRLASHGIRLIIDESFVEFTDEGSKSSLESEIRQYPNLVIFKSLGKIFGVCGLRLGYMLCADDALVSEVRRRLPAWSVNTLAEFFLRALPRYRQAAEDSWHRVRRDRDQLFAALSEIDDMKVLRPDANFVFCRLPHHWPDGEILADRLLSEHRLLIRHSGAKTIEDGVRYLRIATRSLPENASLVERLKDAARITNRGAAHGGEMA